jgi:hypothetical protein
MRLIPPLPPAWKTIGLPGLLFGILLALIQISLVLRGPYLGSFLPIILSVLLFYLVIPALIALLVTHRTQQPFIGYRVGKLTGVSCAVILLLITVIYLTFTLAYHPRTAADDVQWLNILLGIYFVFSLGLNIVGVMLAMLGAFLGSREWRRGSSSEEKT